MTKFIHATRTMSKSCRICDSVLSRTHYVALFSRESLASDLANRLSKVADVPVASEDGLPLLRAERFTEWFTS